MKYIVLFSGLISILLTGGCSTKMEHVKTDSLAYNRQPVLENRYVTGDHQKEKKLLKKKVKHVNQSVHQELDYFSEWFVNVGEAMDMMR